MNKKNILLIDCPDEAGLVYTITKILYKNKLNIIRNGEFVVPEDNHFFMRTEFDGKFDRDNLLNELTKELSGTAKIKLYKEETKNIILFATKEHHCLSDLLIRNFYNENNSNIQAIVSNHKNLKEIADKFSIPFYYVSHKNKIKADFETEIIEILQQYKPDYIVLAKFMRILSQFFVSKYQNKIINIHHSFLPAFIGANPYKQAYDRGVKIIGATAHFINENLDAGPIIHQDIAKIDHRYSIEDIKKAGREIEKNVLARALDLILNDRVFVYQNKTIIFD